MSEDGGQVLDDSKALNEHKPMELIIGKKFKLEVWEKAIKTMWMGEVAKFSVVKELVYDYPIVAKQLREYYAKTKCSDSKCKHEPKPEQKMHCCGFNVLEHGVGHPDLDELLKQPKPLDFTFEILRVEQPGEYEKETWTLSDDEKIKKIPKLKEEGNGLFKEKKFESAAKKYEEALGLLEHFMLREKPNDVEWNELNEQKMPILLNFSLCKFHLGEFYAVIEHTTKVLEHQPRNVKALFRRAKANSAVWNIEEAERDFRQCKEIDSDLAKEVDVQLAQLAQMIAKKEKEERQKFKGKLFG